MKNILNRFSLATLLILPTTQVLGENKINENEKTITQQDIDSFIKTINFVEKTVEKSVKSTALLAYSALASYYTISITTEILKHLKNIPSRKVAFSNYISLATILATTGVIAAGNALEISPEIIEYSPDFLKNIETKIKESKSNLINLMKKNKKKSVAILIACSLFSGMQPIHNPNPIIIITCLGSSAITAKLALDLIQNK
mgnify:FL=1